MCSPDWRSLRPAQVRPQLSTQASATCPSFAHSLWEHRMSNLSESATGLARLYSIPSRNQPFELRDKRGDAAVELTRGSRADGADVSSSDAVVSAIRQADRLNTRLWLPLLTFLIESFALYAASYCA